MNEGCQPAFPATEANGCNSGVFGMTKRELIAMHVFSALMPLGEMGNAQLAKHAVNAADALLVELAKAV